MIPSLHAKLSCSDECRLHLFCAVFIKNDCYRFLDYCVKSHIFLCRAHGYGRPADPNYHSGSRDMLVDKKDAYE